MSLLLLFLFKRLTRVKLIQIHFDLFKNHKSLKSSSALKSSDILTFLLSKTNLHPEVANLTCIDIMNGAVETVIILFLLFFIIVMF